MNKPMELKDTAAMMCSEDYKERFLAEFHQLGIRYEKLKAMLQKYDEGVLNIHLTCPRSIYDLQLRAMGDYLAVLEARAKIEDIL